MQSNPDATRPTFDELHAGKAAELIPKAVRGADDRVVDHLQGDAPGAYCRLPASH